MEQIIILDNDRVYTSTQFILLKDTCVNANGVYNLNHEIKKVYDISDLKQMKDEEIIKIIDGIRISAKLEREETEL